jgi:hypothetical protein
VDSPVLYKHPYQSIFIFYKEVYQSTYILHRKIGITGEQMKINMEIRWKNVLLATIVCLGLCIILSLASVLPCGYHDAADGKFAGYGYHSLADVASNGFEWNADAVPHLYERYSGTGPYIASAEYWVVALHFPIFLAIIFLGVVIVRYPVSINRKSR